jgi:Flp pilus assembly protein TadD
MTDAVIAAAEKHDVPLVDYTAILTERSRARGDHGLLGNAEFLDHVHPTIEGHRILGRALLDHLVARGVAKPDSAWNDAKARSIADALRAELTPRDHGIALRNLAMVLRWAGKIAESDRLLAEAIEAVPDDPDALVLLARELHRKGELDESLALLRRAVALNAKLPIAWASLGAVLRDLGRPDEALDANFKAVHLDPNDAQAHGNLGMELALRGAFDPAEHHLREWVRIEPENPTAYARLGTLLSRRRKFDDALKQYALALDLSPDDPSILQSYGATFADAGRFPEAIEQYERSLRHRPDHAETLTDLGRVLNLVDRADEAESVFRRALEADPHSSRVHSFYGRLLVERGQYRRAIALWDSAIAESPDGVGLLNELAWLLATCTDRGLRDGRRAVTLAERADRLMLHRDPLVLHSLAAAWAECGEFEPAIRLAGNAERLAQAEGDRALVRQIQERVRSYRSGINP